MNNNFSFPGWELVEFLGEGGFSKVYKIRKIGSDELSAVKVILVPQSLSEFKSYVQDGYTHEDVKTIFKDQAQNITSEFRIMSEFNNKLNFVHSYEDLIIENKETNGFVVLMRMELLDTLSSHFLGRQISIPDAIRVGIDICTALEECSKKNIIHRDIKPQNIFVDNEGNYKLGDFGIAKIMDHTTKATKIGTPYYISPEVYNGKPYNSSADIYSLGLVLYWLLNEKRLPFIPLPPNVPTTSETSDAINRRIAGEKFSHTKNGNDEIDRIIFKACEYDPSKRYSSATEFKNDLEKLYKNILITTQDAEEIASTSQKNNIGCTIKSSTVENSEKGISMGAKPRIEPNSRLRTDNTNGISFQSQSNVANNNKPSTSNNSKSDNNSDDPKKGKKKAILLIIFMFILLSVLSAYFLIFNNGKDGDVSTDSESIDLSSDDSADNKSSQASDNSSGFESNDVFVSETDESLFNSEEPNISQDSTSSEESSNDIVTLSSINVSELPNKTIYYVGDAVDVSGLIIDAVYSNGTTETINNNFTFSPTTIETAGKQAVTVYFENQTCTFEIEAAEVTVESIMIIGLPDTYYMKGQTLSTDGLVLKVTYNNGVSEEISSGFTCYPIVLNNLGAQTITVTYENKTTTFDVNVTEVPLTKISLKNEPTKKNYFVGDTFDMTGLSIIAQYGDGSSKTITSGIACTPSQFTEPGNQTVTITYGGRTATFTVNVTAVKVSSVSVKSKPTKTNYFVGDNLSTSGLSLNVSYNNGDVKTISSGFTFSPATLSKEGTQTITVTYSGKSTSFTVNVSKVAVSNISIKTKPSKTVYNVGDTFSASGLVLTASYNNGDIKTITNGFTCSPTTFSIVGTQTITVSYSGKTTTFTVTVKAITITVSFDAGEGTVSTSSKTVTSGSAFGSLPTPTLKYSRFLGWYTSENTKVSSTTICTYKEDITLYAMWQLKDITTDWVLASSVPAGAAIVENQWTYTKTETQESTEATLAGWTQTGNYWKQTGTGTTNYASFPSGFSTSNSYYKNFAKAPYSEYDDGSTKREVNDEWAGYIYWHWMYNVNYANTSDRTIADKNCSAYGLTFKYFYAIASTVNCSPYSDKSYVANYVKGKAPTTYNCHSILPSSSSSTNGMGTPRMLRFDYYSSTYTDYEKIYQYKKVTTGIKSSTEVTESDSISNIQHYVKYRPA